MNRKCAWASEAMNELDTFDGRAPCMLDVRSYMPNNAGWQHERKPKGSAIHDAVQDSIAQQASTDQRNIR